MGGVAAATAARCAASYAAGDHHARARMYVGAHCARGAPAGAATTSSQLPATYAQDLETTPTRAALATCRCSSPPRADVIGVDDGRPSRIGRRGRGAGRPAGRGRQSRQVRDREGTRRSSPGRRAWVAEIEGAENRARPHRARPVPLSAHRTLTRAAARRRQHAGMLTAAGTPARSARRASSARLRTAHPLARARQASETAICARRDRPSGVARARSSRLAARRARASARSTAATLHGRLTGNRAACRAIRLP